MILKNKNDKHTSNIKFINNIKEYWHRKKMETLKKDLGLATDKRKGTRYVSKQKNIEKLRKMSKDNNFKNKLAIKFSAITLACGMLLTSSAMSNENFNTNIKETVYTNSQNIEQTYYKDNVEDITNNQKFDVEKNENMQMEISKIEEKEPEILQEKILNEEEIKEDSLDSSQIPDTESNIKMKDVLMATLNIGFNNEFKMDSGRFYEAPNDTGRSGTYENIDTNIKITLVDAIKDGKLVCYKPSSNMTLAEIYADSDEIISVHTQTTGGLILGWNSNIDEIEKALIKSELSKIEQNLTQEEINYINNIDFDDTINIKDKDVIKNLAKLKQAQSTIKNQEKSSEINEQER